MVRGPGNQGQPGVPLPSAGELRRWGVVRQAVLGIILTPLVREEMSGPGAENYQQTIATSCVGRVGTVDEIATAAAFLLGPDAGFITGADLLIDGGVIAALRGVTGGDITTSQKRSRPGGTASTSDATPRRAAIRLVSASGEGPFRNRRGRRGIRPTSAVSTDHPGGTRERQRRRGRRAPM